MTVIKIVFNGEDMELNGENSKYSKIIDLPHYVSPHRIPMSRHDRAAQFAPFAALSGYSEDIQEAERITDSELELSEDMLLTLNRKMDILLIHLEEKPQITVTYFLPDPKKEGGKYFKITSRVADVFKSERIMVFENKNVLSLDSIYDMESEIFVLD